MHLPFFRRLSNTKWNISMSEFKYKALLTMMMNAAREACNGLKYEDREGDARVCLENALFYVQRKLEESQMVPLFGDDDDGKTS